MAMTLSGEPFIPQNCLKFFLTGARNLFGTILSRMRLIGDPESISASKIRFYLLPLVSLSRTFIVTVYGSGSAVGCCTTSASATCVKSVDVPGSTKLFRSG